MLEDEGKINGILKGLPTEEYYSLLRSSVHERFPGVRPDVVEHLCELEEFFDVCISIGFSLGVGKMELLKTRVKLLGEYVTRQGRQPDPVKVEAIKNWGPIRNLKEVQEFLGTCNYSRLMMGPKYAAAAEGLRRYVKGGDSAFPMTPRGLAAVERLKSLVCETTLLAVPDERAALGGWRPYEQLADCSGTGLGGAQCQMSPEFNKMVPLAYVSKSLTPAQSLWPPFRQEHYAQLTTRRFMRQQFGSIPAILYTDHQNLVRLQDAPLDRIDPVAYRINAELTQDGSELRNLAGRTIRIADGLSRSTLSKELTPERQMELQRVLEARTQDMIRLQALLKDENDDFFHIEPEMIGKVAAEDFGLIAEERKEVKILFLAPYLSQVGVIAARDGLKTVLERQMPEVKMNFLEVEPPFEEPGSGEYFWLAPYARQPSEVRKRYRKQILAGIVTVLRAVGRMAPDFLAGIQQGGLIAALCANPLLVEAAARQRVATESELAQLRAAWPRLRSVLSVRPFATVAHSTIERLLEAVPEIAIGQRSVSCCVVAGNTATERKFSEELVNTLGARLIASDLAGIGWQSLLLEPTLLQPWSSEGCVGCGKRAQLT